MAKNDTNIGEAFQRKMIKGNINGALRLLSSEQCNGILPLNNVTMNDLHLKHPEASPINDDLLLQGPVMPVNEVIYESIGETSILRACVKRKGAACLSGWEC